MAFPTSQTKIASILYPETASEERFYFALG